MGGTMKRIQVGIAMCLMAGALAGCGSWSASPAPEQKLCTELSQLDGAVTQLASLPPNAPASPVQQPKAKRDAEYQAVADARKKANIGIARVTTAYNTPVKAAGTATSQGVAAAKDQFDQAAAQLNQARVQ